jgi:hypothetical protein
MKQQFVELTPKEIFFGNAPKLQSAATGALINTAAAPTQTMTQSQPVPFSTSQIAQQQAAFVFSDFLWKYRWHIGIGVLVIGGIYIHNSNKKREEDKKLNYQ